MSVRRAGPREGVVQVAPAFSATVLSNYAVLSGWWSTLHWNPVVPSGTYVIVNVVLAHEVVSSAVRTVRPTKHQAWSCVFRQHVLIRVPNMAAHIKYCTQQVVRSRYQSDILTIFKLGAGFNCFVAPAINMQSITRLKPRS